ncbi:MAG: D-alanyl-D-alanine carboxypeptidase/D-alanyl-D-alanine-endopeptidase [Ilumatobacter sp.]|uniref:D-alanyl-D-alanine carboxypeptidase/D-alanyl-D-alanine endopeptidase n=1 Tax=Ilumatobacter sp. TaxID=1967498 RepID=UPI003C724F4D
MNRPPDAMSRLEARQPNRRPEPRRSGAGPLVVLAIFALVPALALYAVFVWSSSKIDDNEAAPPPPTTIVAPPLPDEPLRNSMLTFRRMPALVARGLNVDQFVADVAPFLATINDRSCATVSVDGNPVGSANGDVAVIPASTAKIVVAAVALEQLGADRVFTTRVFSGATPDDGVIEGDLVLLGGGDPLLSSDWYPTSGLEPRPVFDATSLDTLADRVQAAGVTQVTGSVLGDGSRYDDEFFAPGWGNGVAGLEAGPYDSLIANDARVFGEERRGDNPNSAAAREFTRLLSERGVVVTGEPGVGLVADVADEPVELASIESVPLAGVIAEMLTNSDNNTAELLVKEIGLEAVGEGEGTRDAGVAAMTEQLEQWGVDTTNIVLADGSGLSLDNRLTCNALVAVLQRSGSSETIGAALPIAGETGTLADVFTDHPVAGRLLGKTGTLNNPPFNQDPPAVKALAGYLPVEGGGAVEYALVLNGPTISDQSEYRPVWNELADALDTYPSGASPADVGLR